MIGVAVVELKQLLDVGERETQPLAAEDKLKPRPVAGAVDAIAADALRREQAAILVEADGAVRQLELGAEIADRIKPHRLARRLKGAS
jgi:hypothetical protein